LTYLILKINKNVTIIVIGMELAASMVGKAKSITVIETAEAPLQSTLGIEIGNWLRKVC